MSKSALRESFMVDGPSGRLECLLETPQDQPVAGVAVVCHPHPVHGGTMHNKVVHTLCRAANDIGYAAVRFNFRGVGESDGSYDEGRGERDDARAIVEWSRSKVAGPLLLAGFSFGSAVALQIASEVAPVQLISVAPPVDRIGFDGWRQPDCRWLIVQGDTDELVDVNSVVSWVDGLAPGPELIVLPGVDHFFHRNLNVLRETLVANLAALAA